MYTVTIARGPDTTTFSGPTVEGVMDLIKAVDAYDSGLLADDPEPAPLALANTAD